MKTTICPLCVGVSSLWLLLSAGMAWGYLAPAIYLVPAALLMGGSVVGIAYLGEKRCRWAQQHPLEWKSIVVGIGMPIAYLLVTHLTPMTVISEFILLLIIAYLFFIKRPMRAVGEPNDNGNVQEIKKQMEQCC